ncbi:MAG: hypothetical protein H0X51_03680, partial [Parachlamydiaceae bacterium]|nr:hypothetical protein [Parachlamydiaceae bacterium]
TLIQNLSEHETKFEFGNKRLSRRGERMVKALAKNSGKSLPQFFCKESDLRGAYRFLGNSLINPKSILKPHSAETVQRCKTQDVVLVIQNSSDLDME